MTPEALLPLLRDVAQRAELEVRRPDGETSSAVCRIKGKLVVMVHAAEPAAKECELLVEALKQVDLTGVFVPPAVREELDR